MQGLRDICLKNCKVSHEGLKNLNWKHLENINIIGVSIRGKFVSNFIAFHWTKFQLFSQYPGDKSWAYFSVIF